jgi:hypothetical protein
VQQAKVKVKAKAKAKLTVFRLVLRVLQQVLVLTVLQLEQAKEQAEQTLKDQ